jgi:anthranilate phosphoribosyltransferase
MALHEYMKRVVEQREVLSRSQARALLNLVLAGSTEADQPGSPHSLQLAALLGAIAARGVTAAELAGFAEAMLAAAIPVPLNDAERALLVDTCGTGGDDTGTFNISTAAALVAAAAGADAGSRMMVAKHGNRAVTSQCGSADVLEALGIPISLTPAAGAASLRRHRFAFLHAPSLHPAMKAVMPIRRALAVRTAFNVLGPLANPAGARAQVMGVYSARLVPIVANAMLLLGVRHAFVVHGEVSDEASAGGSGIDELSISGPTQLAEVRGDAVTFSRLTPEQVGLASAPISSLRGGDAATNAAILRAIFAGEPGPRRDVVLLNAAAVLIAADVVPSSTPQSHRAFRDAIALAARAIDSGAVTALVAALTAEGTGDTSRTEP